MVRTLCLGMCRSREDDVGDNVSFIIDIDATEARDNSCAVVTIK